MSFFKFRQTVLAVAATAAIAGSFGTGHAQAVRDSGQLALGAQFASSTCVLDLGDTASTTAGSKTINFGTMTTASISGVAAGGFIKAAAPFTISLKGPGGTGTCNLGSATKWDISVDVPPNQVSTTFKPLVGVLTNQAPAAIAATNVALQLNLTPTGFPVRTIDFSFKPSAYNTTLLSGFTTPGMAPTGTFLMEFYLVKGTGAVTVGAFQASLPMLVFYK
jgi:hypothetical protein